MPEPTPHGYSGAELSSPVAGLLEILVRYGFTTAASDRFAGKTINLLRDGARCGYINSTVLGKGAVLGYHFTWSGTPNNACAPEIADRLVPIFCEKYGCQASDLIVHKGTGSNLGRTYLLIRTPTVALQVLLKDAGQPIDPSVEITKRDDRYIEGALRDVVMRAHERSSAARQACLAFHGYDCVVCKVNLRKRYHGLPMEVIHVHHEEPFALQPGPRTTDAAGDLKPVCPNCHAVIHSRTPPYTVMEVQRMLESGT